MATKSLLIGALMALCLPTLGLAQSQTAGTTVMEFDLSAHPADQEARLWLPHPVSDEDQLITDIAVKALCRAAGVPAREIFRIRMAKETVAAITSGQHCWAEFFLPGYGWVPVDPADVLKMMLIEKLAPEDAKTGEYRDYFWGAWDSYRVKLAVGRDLVLTPRQAGPPLNTFGYPYAEVGGRALDWLVPQSFKYTFTYRR